jgi:hypothetical protein
METNEQRLKRFIAARDQAVEHKDRMVALLAAEINRQKTTGTRIDAPGKCYSYPTNYSVSQPTNYSVSQAKKFAPRITHGITVEQVRAEQQKIRDRFAYEQELNAALSRVQAGWREL